MNNRRKPYLVGRDLLAARVVGDIHEDDLSLLEVAGAQAHGVLLIALRMNVGNTTYVIVKVAGLDGDGELLLGEGGAGPDGEAVGVSVPGFFNDDQVLGLNESLDDAGDLGGEEVASARRRGPAHTA